MVDVTDEPGQRVAEARAIVRMQPETHFGHSQWGSKKGDVLAVAQVAGIMAAKQTSSLSPCVIPLCSPPWISFRLGQAEDRIVIHSRVKTTGQTGVKRSHDCCCGSSLDPRYG